MHNILIIDRERFDAIRQDKLEYARANIGEPRKSLDNDVDLIFNLFSNCGVMSMDFIAIQEHGGAATIIKNRFTEHVDYIDNEIYNMIKREYLHKSNRDC